MVKSGDISVMYSVLTHDLQYKISSEFEGVNESQLRQLMKEYEKAQKGLSEKELLEKMGFPENWEKITRYRK